MQTHDFLFADTADDCATGIGTRHRRASEETQESIGRDTDKPPSKQPRELTGIRQGQQNTMLTTGEASGDTMRRHTQKKEKSREECHIYMFRKHEDIPKKSTNSTITYRL